MRIYRKGMVLNSIIGAIDGLSMVLALPAMVSLATGETAWGLNFTWWMIMIALLALANAVLRYLGAMNSYQGALDTLNNVHASIGRKLARLPLGWFEAGRAGGISRLVSDGLMEAAQVDAHLLQNVIRNAVALPVLIAGAWLWQWKLGLAMVIALPFMVALMLLAQHIDRAGKRPKAPANRELADRIVEFARTQPALRAAGKSGHYEPLEAAQAESKRANQRGLWLNVLANLVGGIDTQIVVVVLAIGAAIAASTGALGPVETLVIIGIVIRFFQNVTDLVSFAIGIQSGVPSIKEIVTILGAEELPEPQQSAPLNAPGTIQFENVNFEYLPGKPVLENINFQVPAQSVVAIVGPSGSGKTTIARLIARFWDVTSGTVCVGGVDVRKLKTADLMAQLSMVFQDVYLFDDTLLNNILIGREDATREDAIAAAELAGVGEIARRLPNGWETRVGEGGRSLSGGERQRVSVARALLKQAPIVLLDEATSALDAENEQHVLASVEQLRHRSTLLVIAHKLDTVRHADQIIVLSADGKIAQRGTHDELVNIDGPYRTFWQRRVEVAGWRLTEER
ncbi:hypothetical protein BM477_00140 [Boudabousia marimammalium]|uniref:ABC transporter n=1 Tax=Boudabousia marimammalium TaxID=156892 RepID=A0A1Q5PSU7_9ACTO|nr:hypothetical protein BM477_00140 [Boudabousia marimammalium]